MTSEKEAIQAVRTLLDFIGEDPEREGLKDTPKRVIKAYREWFSGYKVDPEAILQRTFHEVEGYDEIIILKDIPFSSYCEHHMVPIIGKVHIGYIPNGRVVGISKLARIVDAYAKRLQIQESMTRQIANAIDSVLSPLGVAVIIIGEHLCISTRGVNKTGAGMITSAMLGAFRSNEAARHEFLSLVGEK